jgi:hypothetical protein
MRLTIPTATLATLAMPCSDADGALSLGRATLDVDIDFTYLRGAPAVHTLRNGDPGYPADPDELDIHRITARTPLLWNGAGQALAVAAGTDLTPLLSAQHLLDLEEQLLVAIADAADTARIDAAELAREERLLDRGR